MASFQTITSAKGGGGEPALVCSIKGQAALIIKHPTKLCRFVLLLLNIQVSFTKCEEISCLKEVRALRVLVYL